MFNELCYSYFLRFNRAFWFPNWHKLLIYGASGWTELSPFAVVRQTENIWLLGLLKRDSELLNSLNV